VTTYGLTKLVTSLKGSKILGRVVARKKRNQRRVFKMKNPKERFLLPLDIQFFSDPAGGGQADPNQQADPQGQTDPNTSGQNQDPQGQGSNNKQEPEINIPKSRFDEVNNKYKELQEQLDNLNKAKEQEELEALKKKGEFEELYNTTQQELETYKANAKQTSERVEQLEGIIQSLVDSELSAVPEELHDLIPSNFTPEQKLTWISQAKEKGIFGTVQKNEKEEQPLGGSTNQQQQTPQDVTKMSVSQLFRSAYGKK
jgi:chromosome segregation ATPase